MSQLFDDEFMGPLTGALSGGSVDVLDGFEPTMDFWNDKHWLMPGRQPVSEDGLTRLVTGFVDDGDPAHAEADRRARQAGVDVDAPGADLLSIARSQIGSPYIWADVNPVGSEGGVGSGFDCSGFTQWVLSRFGISTPHLSSAQQQEFRHVGRENLQPGDLVFFHYSDRNGPGDTADHVGLYVGNGKMIAASSGNDAIVEQSVDWEHFVGGGATGIDAASGQPATRRGRGFRRGGGATPIPEDLTLVPLALSGGTKGTGLPSQYAGGLPQAMGDLLMPERLPGTRRSFNGSRGAIEKQIYKAFIDSGHPEMAKLVGSKDFTAWVNAESGWNPEATSPANNQGLANDGLYQVWRGHSEFNADGQVAGMSPYQQTLLIMRYFDLTPDDVHRYAAAIRSGEYSGWG